MANPLDQIDTIIVVMLENRSFDHLLGYRSLPPWNQAVDGLSADPAWRARFANGGAGPACPPFKLKDAYEELSGDPPHERANIAVQLGPLAGPAYPMNGFVQSYPGPGDAAAGPPQPLVMGYFDGTDLATTDFLANNFTICDRWFSALPAGTQPNRLMAMGGLSRIDVNRRILPNQELAYDWLSRRGIRWRVYHDGIPFFTMMPDRIAEILNPLGNFRGYHHFRLDVKAEDAAAFPQVIFIEPRYTDAPHLEIPTDDHAPSPVGNGQDYLMGIYFDLVANPARWARTLMVVTYDEHGGFFDHVSPPLIPTAPPPGAGYPAFPSLGVRVPAYLVSPLARPGHVHSEILDHLSILKLIGDKFGNGSYSPEVDARPVGRIQDALADTPVSVAIPYPHQAGYTAEAPPAGVLPQGFQAALDTIRTTQPAAAQKRFPELLRAFPPGPPSTPPPA